MALELETTIMNEIGLGQNYRWFNGSGSCEYIRQQAMRKLPEAIEKHHQGGDKIASPYSRLMNLAQQAASWDASQYELTKAWEVASYIIAAHIHAAAQSEEQQDAFLAEQCQSIKEHCQPISKHKVDSWELDPYFQALRHMEY